MRLRQFSISGNRLTQFLGTFSVRTRLILLAIVPVVGFLANGVTYIAGEGEVDSAFQTVQTSRALADASRDFKIAISQMRIASKDFATSPKAETVAAYTEAEAAAFKWLGAIESSANGMRADDLASLRQQLSTIKKNFDIMISEQQDLGFNDEHGLRGQLRDAGDSRLSDPSTKT